MAATQRGVGQRTAAGLLHVHQLVGEAHDFGVLLLTHVGQEVQQGLLQVS